jgi:hypothetical protein
MFAPKSGPITSDLCKVQQKSLANRLAGDQPTYPKVILPFLAGL